MTETVESRAASVAGGGDQPKLLIGGTWTDPHSTETLEVFSPATGERVGSVPHADATDVDTAVATARAAFDAGVWTSVPPAQRADIVARVADLIDERSDEVTALVSAEMGAPPSAVSTLQQLSLIHI